MTWKAGMLAECKQFKQQHYDKVVETGSHHIPA
jgi:hypothetical protein